MSKDFENIYKTARELAGITQEEAASRIGVSWRSVSNYETFTTIPRDEVVDVMVRVYGTPWLAYMHFKHNTLLGRKYLPSIDIGDLAKAVLRFQKEMADVREITPTMIEVACDGVIDKSEQEKWDKVTREVLEFIGAGISVIYSKC
ncbi:helix-turn-helix transcriptional regulator [Clostridium cylindrosporum]|uniref:Putative prophage lambdaCh01, transcriptional regulator n=1 Tax=Clostridium cylindrosporum DSM 605 TaxID=1121307 RepID=A0A0J8DAU9_CLOCY|nr:helix-turn-helix transcriptional regulator [Clostridium cylindrosporum]KMT22977.1 putative prophage lambdaCh01, transcriptional regulator [Clostridium cylindrosporum DSM 605]